MPFCIKWLPIKKRVEKGEKKRNSYAFYRKRFTSLSFSFQKKIRKKVKTFISSSACKGEQTEKSTTPPGSISEGRTEGYRLSQNWRDRILGISTPQLQEEPVSGRKLCTWKSLGVCCVWTSMRVKKSRSTQSQGGEPPKYCHIYLQNPKQIPTIIREKSLHASSREWKETILKYARALYFLTKPALREN